MEYLMVKPSLGSTLAFVAVVVAVSLSFPLAVWFASDPTRGADAARRSALRACGGTLLVLGVSAALAELGVLSRLPKGGGVMLYVLSCVGGATALAFSDLGRRVASLLPLWALCGFQLFRLPLELVLHQWYMEGVIPVQMSYAGHNFDILTGLLALSLAPFFYLGKLGRRAAWLFNLVGFGLLVNVASIAVRSSPVPLRTYTEEPAVLLAFHAPYTWILPICVAGALFGHLVTFRRLVGAERSVASTRAQ